MPIPVLSQELIDYIIDTLCDESRWITGYDGVDGMVLKCALVSRSFVSRSRQRYFHTLTINIRPSCVSRLEHFYELLQSDLNTVGIHVVEFELTFVSFTKQHEQLTPQIGRVMRMLAIYLPRVKELILGARLNSLDCEIQTFIGGLQCLTTLNISCAQGASFTDLIGLITAARSLEKLELHYAIWKPALCTDITTPFPAKLKCLDIGSGQLSKILQWCLSANTIPDIEIVQLRQVNADDLSTVVLFLKRLGNSLQHFELKRILGTSIIVQGLLQHVDLSHNRYLRSITLPPVTVLHHTLPVQTHWLLLLLSKINSSQLQEINITLFASSIHEIPWQSLDKILSRCSSLRDVQCAINITPYDQDSEGELEDILRENMPQTQARGVLSVYIKYVSSLLVITNTPAKFNPDSPGSQNFLWIKRQLYQEISSDVMRNYALSTNDGLPNHVD